MRLFLCLLLLGLIPKLLTKIKQEHRQRILAEQVPDFLDLLALTLQSGQNLEQALRALTQNPQNILEKMLNQELKNLHWGVSLDEVLKKLKTSIKISSFQQFLATIQRSRKLGVSLSETLVIQSDLIRQRRRQHAEELARTASIKISLPLVLFIFPALLILYLGPGILMLLQ